MRDVELHHSAGHGPKGDLDVQVRVPSEGLVAAVTALMSLYEPDEANPPVDGRVSFRGDGDPSVGVHITAIGSLEDKFSRTRDLLLARADLRRALDELKARHEGSSMTEYREAKAKFFAYVNDIATDPVAAGATEPIELRTRGTNGPHVVVLHGGPGAPGSVASLARLLSDEFRVLEALHRRSGSVPLTVERHIEDLASEMPRPASLVGWSWGAMLALSFAASHPDLVRAVALVGCGTYDPVSRDGYHRTMLERLGPEGRVAHEELQRRLDRSDDEAERDDLRARFARLSARVQAVDPIEDVDSTLRADARGADETWADAMRRQDAGIEPASFAAITAPVLMLHGDADPHPGRATRDVLVRHISDLEFVELPNCGHAPWLERQAREQFLDRLRSWLRATA